MTKFIAKSSKQTYYCIDYCKKMNYNDRNEYYVTFYNYQLVPQEYPENSI